MNYKDQIQTISQLDLPQELKQSIFRDFLFDAYKHKYSKVMTQLKTYDFKTYGFKHYYHHRYSGFGYNVLVSYDDLMSRLRWHNSETGSRHNRICFETFYPIVVSYCQIIH